MTDTSDATPRPERRVKRQTTPHMMHGSDRRRTEYDYTLTPRPDDMPEMVWPEREIVGSFSIRELNIYKSGFHTGAVAERARSLNAQIKTALADGERDGRQLAEDCRITPEAANTPCYVPPNSVSLTERIAAAINSAETAARAAIRRAALEEAAQEMLRRFGGTPMGNALAAAIRTLADQSPSLQSERWRPIESAPTVYGSGSDCLLTDGVYQWIGCLILDPEGRHCWQAGGGFFIKPTHWKPLSPLPAEDKSSK